MGAGDEQLLNDQHAPEQLIGICFLAPVLVLDASRVNAARISNANRTAETRGGKVVQKLCSDPAMNTAPIYLLLNGEANGPHEVAEVEEMLQGRKIHKVDLACIEGMKEWRAIPETLVWARGHLLAEMRDLVLRVVSRMVDLEVDLPSARSEVMRATARQGDSDLSESIGTILDINMSLLRNHRLYCAKQDKWTPDASDLWPALELVRFSKLTFPRDWETAWQTAGGRSSGGKMVALTNDSVWTALSDFGFPFPPFSMDGAMWVEQVAAAEAREGGLAVPDGLLEFGDIKPFEVVGCGN